MTESPNGYNCHGCGKFTSYSERPKGRKWCSETCNSHYRERDPEARRRQSRESYYRRRDDVLDRVKQDRKENPEKYRKYARTAYAKHREDRIQRSNKWQKENPDRVAARYAKRKSRESGFTVTKKFQRRSLHRSGYRCIYCLQKLDTVNRRSPGGLHWDHVIPLSRGGRNSEGNLVPSCATCNMKKGVKYLVEWRSGRMDGKCKSEELSDRIRDFEKIRDFATWEIERLGDL